MTKACLKCGELKSVTEFNFKDKAKNRLNGRCKKCTREAIRSAYYKNRAHYLQYRAQYNKRMILKKYQVLSEYLATHPCVDCGIHDPRVLQFDHVRGVKKKSVSEMVYRAGASIKSVLEEISKCDVRCANCHAIKTANERRYYARFLEESDSAL